MRFALFLLVFTLPIAHAETVELQAGLSFLTCSVKRENLVECQRAPVVLAPISVELKAGEGDLKGQRSGEASVKARINGFLVEGIVSVTLPVEGSSDTVVEAYIAATKEDTGALLMDFVGDTRASSPAALARTTWMGRSLSPAPLELVPYFTVQAAKP